MRINKLSPADVEAIVTRLRMGHSVLEVAGDLGISVEMILCAKRKWSTIHRQPSLPTLMWG